MFGKKENNPSSQEKVQVPQERHKLFVFKDSKSTSYGLPIAAQTRGMFLRDVSEELQQKRVIWAKHPQDFSIFEVGEYDAHTGDFHLYETKNCLGLVQDFIVEGPVKQ